MTVYEVESFRTDSYWKGVRSVSLHQTKETAIQEADSKKKVEISDEYSTVRFRAVDREVI